MNRKQLILTHARDLIAKPRGWVKGESMKRRDDGRVAYCCTGALRAAYGGVGNPSMATTSAVEKALRDALREVTGLDYEGIVGINDRSTTRKRDILAGFDKAIDAVATKKKGA